MGYKLEGLLLFAALLAFSSLLVNLCEGWSFTTKQVINVVNNVTQTASIPYNELLVHCKSGDDDLGEQHIAYQGTYTFSFHEQLFGQTLFWCYLGFKDDQGRYAHKSFDVFAPKKERDCIDKQSSKYICTYTARDQNIYGAPKNITENWEYN